MRRHLITILSLLAVLALVPASTALGAAGFEETTETMYTFNHNGTDCVARDGFLVSEPNPAGSGCGYIYGAPIGEVEHQTQSGLFENARTYTTEATFAPVILDGSREVTGVVTVTARQSACASPAPVPCVPHAGIGSGIGQIIVDLDFGGKVAGGQPFATVSSLATTSVEAFIMPGQTEVAIPFAITLPASANGKSYSALALSTDVHGWHVNTGYAVTDGRTSVDIPTLTPLPDEVCGNGIDDDGDELIDEGC